MEVKVDETPTTTGKGTRLPGLRGVDHVGITVPDIEQATVFSSTCSAARSLQALNPQGMTPRGTG